MVFGKAKLFVQAMSPSNIKKGIELSKQSLANGGQLTPEQLEQMTPEQRAHYEAQMQQARELTAANADRVIEGELARRVLRGPAGDYLYGPMPDREKLTDITLRSQLEASKAEFMATLRNPFGKKAPPPPAPTPPVSADPGAQAAHERSVRDEARTPYLAPGRSPVVRTRLALDPKDAVTQLATWLGTAGLAARPDLVYGVYRVPDHIAGGGLMGMGWAKASVVEWEVVHAASPGLPEAHPAAVAGFRAKDRWAARRPGEPSILDEDLGIDYLRQADLGPEQCLGVARMGDVDAGSAGSGDGSGEPYIVMGVTGVLAFHPWGLADGVQTRMQQQMPHQVLPAPDGHVAVLNWGDVRRAVAPRPDQLIPVPSPFPYLPATGGELLEAYLGVVGVRPQDCYSAQVTVDQPSNIIGGSAHSVTTGAASEIAADGKDRKRFRGGSRVVVAYRDHPDYAAGRERWAAYERDVLQARLDNRVAVRAPVDKQSRLDRGVLGGLVKGMEAVGSIVDSDWDPEPFKDLPYYRYCWPPIQ